MKLSISINDDLLQEMDNYCKANFMSRSGLIAFSCTQFLNQAKAVKAMEGMALAMREAATKNECSPETLKQLEQYEQLVMQLTAKQA